jgi:hypothetical protein
MVLLLGWLHPVYTIPELAAIHAIGGGGSILVPIPILLACCACVLNTNRMMAMHPTISVCVAHVSEGVLASSIAETFATIAAVAAATITVEIDVFLHRHPNQLGEHCNSVGEGFDWGHHGLELCIFCFCFITDVGCLLHISLIVYNCHTGNLLNVILSDLVAKICHLIGAFLPHFSGCTALFCV